MRQPRKVKELLDKGVIWVEDGNHGENRPLQNEFSSIGTPFIRPPDLMNGFVNFVDCDRINERARSRVRKGIGRAGDILFTHRATVGRIALAPKGAPEFVANPGVTVWRSLNHELLDIRYLYYFMQTSRFMDQVWSVAGSTDTFPYISLTQQRELDLELPEIEEQRIIGKVLGSLDDKIELNRQMNETLEAMAQAIFHDWFVDFGPTRRKLEGATDPLTVMGGLVQDTERAQVLADLFPAALGDDGLPEGWTERAFGAFVEIIGGGTPKTSNESYWNGSIPWFSVTDTPTKGSVFVDVTEKTISDEGLANSSARLVRAGTTIISARETVGNLALAPHEMTFNQSCYGLQGKGAVGDCFVFLAAQKLVERLKGMAHGSVFSTITRSTFDNIQLAHTPSQIFEAFEILARPMFDKILGNVKEGRTLAATRDLLLPKLMSGEIRLRSAGKAVEVRV